MRFETMDIFPEKYVVLDLETNVLKSKEDDLLSISLSSIACICAVS